MHTKPIFHNIKKPCEIISNTESELIFNHIQKCNQTFRKRKNCPAKSRFATAAFSASAPAISVTIHNVDRDPHYISSLIFSEGFFLYDFRFERCRGAPFRITRAITASAGLSFGQVYVRLLLSIMLDYL